MGQSVEFDIKMRTKDMYKFFLYHTYSRFSGWFGVFLSLAALVMLIVGYHSYDDARKIILLVLALLFTVVNPIMLLSKAKQQMILNPVYKKPLHYTMDETGITISQGEEHQQMEWKQVIRYREAMGVLFVYTSKVHAFIFPLDQVEDSKERILEMVKNHFAEQE